MKALKYLNSFLLKYWKKLLIGLVITISARVFSLFMPSYINESIQVIEQYFRNEISQAEAKQMLLIDIGIIVQHQLNHLNIAAGAFEAFE